MAIHNYEILGPFLIIFLFCHILVMGSLHHFQHIETDCIEHCPFENGTDGAANDLWCDSDCRIKYCTIGCRRWIQSLESNCYTSCNATEAHGRRISFYCLLGCNHAVSSYVQEVKGRIGRIQAPSVIAGSIRNTSVSLHWNTTMKEDWADHIHFLLQWRYASREVGGSWEYIVQMNSTNQSWTVGDLRPYCKYQFRLASILASDVDPLVSDESSTVTTLPSGPPSSPPIHLNTIAMDSTRISISWEPPLFTNGPLVSYVLTLQEKPQGYTALKDVMVNTHSYVFIHLTPNTTYSIKVTARNAIGEGPPAVQIITTPTVEKLRNDSIPTLLFASSNKRVYHKTMDITAKDISIYTFPDEITGIANHVRQKILFVADVKGNISERSLYDDQSSPSVILHPWHIDYQEIQYLSVDWLFNRLYMLVRNPRRHNWRIARCRLDGKGLQYVVDDIPIRPFQIEVDPYNGYLFWTIEDRTIGGLYSVDLADLKDQALSFDPQNPSTKIRLIFQHNHTRAFVVDHTNLRILVTDRENNTFLGISLTGSEKTNIRINVEEMYLNNMSFLVYFNDTFYWIKDRYAISEEKKEDSYYQNQYDILSANETFTGLVLNHALIQPIPIPVKPITNLQCLFGADSVQVSWQPPSNIASRGKGAWQNWLYNVQIENMENGASVFKKDINATDYFVTNLRPNTTYSIRVQAYSSAGDGPWPNTFFIGKTLPNIHHLPSIFWATNEAIYKSSPLGKQVEAVINAAAFQDISTSSLHVISMAFLDDSLYVVTNTSQMYNINLITRNVTLMKNIEAVSVATDWLGRRVYWSYIRRHTISRSLPDGTQDEMLPLSTMANHLTIHSTKGKIVWCTGHSVESASLHGADRSIYWSSYFSGKQVVGLTINHDLDKLYWILQAHDGVSLYEAHIDIPGRSELVSTIEPINIRGPIQYMSDRLLWIEDDSITIVTDVSGRNKSLLKNGDKSHLSFFLVKDSSIRTLPNDTIVIPDPIDIESIAVDGKEDFLNVTWSPVTNVIYGTVYYEVLVLSDYGKNSTVTVNIGYTIPPDWKMPPYTKMLVSIRAYTVWGSASAISQEIRTPPSKPGIPQYPRTYVTFIQRDLNDPLMAEIDFRWSPPRNPNGEILWYKISCWYYEGQEMRQICNDTVSGNVTEYSKSDLLTNTTYVFSVKAATKVGEGPETEPLNVSTSTETPVPKLLIFTSDSLWLADFDLHKPLTDESQKGISSKVPAPPIAVAFFENDNQLFWIDEMQELHSHTLGTNSRIKIRQLNGIGNSLAIDWVGRHLYWSEVDSVSRRSSIYKLDLSRDLKQQSPEFVLSDNGTIRLIEADPFTSRLIWLSVGGSGFGTLMSSNMDGKKTDLFFNQYRVQRDSKHCDCDSNPRIGSTTAVDRSNTKKPRLVWVSAFHGDVWSTDWNGCHCTLELNATDLKRTGWPPSSLAVDRYHFYWSNSTEGRVYYVQRSPPLPKEMSSMIHHSIPSSQSKAFTSKSYVSAESVAGVRNIATLGRHHQPFPDKDCLLPLAVNYEASLMNATSTTLTLSMPSPLTHSHCNSVSMASPSYRIFFGPITNKNENCHTNLTLCKTLISNDKLVNISNLIPYTEYSIRIKLTNHYVKKEHSMRVGTPVKFATNPGAPSVPQNVTVIPLTPESVRVQWMGSEHLNGPNVTYEVYWKTKGVFRVSHKIEQGTEGITNHLMSWDIHQLTPNVAYSFWVKALSVDNQYNESAPVEIVTYEEPKSLELYSATSSSINISWAAPKERIISKLAVEYAEPNNEWKVTEELTLIEANKLYTFRVYDLNVRTKYFFRFRIEYHPFGSIYIWPKNVPMSFETEGDVPDQPSLPVVSEIRHKVFQVFWTPPANNGYNINHYSLEAQKVTDDSDNESLIPWDPVYNGTENFWIVHNLQSGLKYRFRVRALNRKGWSEFSESSMQKIIPEYIEIASSSMNVTLGISVSALAALCSIITVFIVLFFRKRHDKKKNINSTGRSGTGVELSNMPLPDLATLRELPQRENFIQQNNAIYGIGEGDLNEELALLPHIRREDLTLTKFLGSGAFGEVFEGVATNLPGSNQVNIRVAVKTLRKGATEQEKGEFLKEAQLMSHFKHDHILRLLGVCLDTDPNFILLELMEGGDLLSYLRNSRPTPQNPCQLTLQDLVSMCVDVARGCCYLEELHFVHRDLAARNCLVSSLDPQYRVVKIGDFGLARDIYRNDYYRKEGEGLLPVRWMAPESLVDGVFTSQSDVWSFGVLLWEILTLGQQPYPARTNVQVLHFVRAGGRLDRPPNCPDSLFDLMMSCWSYEPCMRPNFSNCLEDLLNLQEKLSNSPITIVHNGHYVMTPVYHSWKTRECISPFLRRSFLDQNSIGNGVVYANTLGTVLNDAILQKSHRNISHGTRLERCSSERDPHRLERKPVPIIRSNSTAGSSSNPHGRYLELLNDSLNGNDGYEIPRVVHVTYGKVRTFPKTNGLLPRFHSRPNLDNEDCLSDVTDESCIANSPTPLCANQVFQSSSLDMAVSSDTEC